MVICVSNDITSSIDEFIENVNIEVQEAIHELNYNLLLTDYNYLKEYGVLTENDDATSSKISWLKMFLDKMIKSVVKLKDTVVDKIKNVGSYIKSLRWADPKKVKAVTVDLKSVAGQVIDSGGDLIIHLGKMGKDMDKMRGKEGIDKIDVYVNSASDGWKGFYVTAKNGSKFADKMKKTFSNIKRKSQTTMQYQNSRDINQNIGNSPSNDNGKRNNNNYNYNYKGKSKSYKPKK